MANMQGVVLMQRPMLMIQCSAPAAAVWTNAESLLQVVLQPVSEIEAAVAEL
jgi:hypothetical protein